MLNQNFQTIAKLLSQNNVSAYKNVRLLQIL